jgi:hypothetical protein
VFKIQEKREQLIEQGNNEHRLSLEFATLQHDAFVVLQEVCSCASISIDLNKQGGAILYLLKAGGVVKSEQVNLAKFFLSFAYRGNSKQRLFTTKLKFI